MTLPFGGPSGFSNGGYPPGFLIGGPIADGIPIGGSPTTSFAMATPFGTSPFGASQLGARPFGGVLPGFGQIPAVQNPMFPTPGLIGAQPQTYSQAIVDPFGALSGAGGLPGFGAPVASGFPISGTPSFGALGSPFSLGAPRNSFTPQFVQPGAVPGGNGQQQAVGMLMGMMQTIMQILGAPTGRSNAPVAFPAFNPGFTTGGGFTPAPVMPNNFSGNFASLNRTQNPQLNQSLAQIAADPEGALLLQQAARLGVSIEIGNPAAELSPEAGSGIITGATISQGTKSRVVLSDPANVKTLVHELVHAVSPTDGNSREEEGIADVVGSRIANRVGGQGGLQGVSERQIFIDKQQFYPALMQSNAIRNTLAALGIAVPV